MEILNLLSNQLNQNGYSKNMQTKGKIGALFAFPINHTPDDCLSCDGYSLLIVDYKDLYKLLGTTFNKSGDAEGTFRVPDYNITKRFLQPGSNAGNQISAGLPSIELALRVDASGKVKSYYGNKTISKYGVDDYGGAMSALTDGNDEPMYNMSDATQVKYRAGDLILDTNIYGKSSTVQPPSQLIHICIKYK